MAFPASWAIAQWLGRGWSCQPTRVQTLGFAPKKNPLAHLISKAQMGSPLVAGPPMCVDHPFSPVSANMYKRGRGYLGLCEKILLSFVKMPCGRSFSHGSSFCNDWSLCLIMFSKIFSSCIYSVLPYVSFSFVNFTFLTKLNVPSLALICPLNVSFIYPSYL